MIVRLTLGDIEQARLVLQGGSALDWHRLHVASEADCEILLRVNGFDPQEMKALARLNEMRSSAVEYLEGNFGFAFRPQIRDVKSISELMLMAA